MKTGRRVFCIGETVLDIIFSGGNPVAAKPGGSMLNSSVSLGRAGIPVYLITDFATDQAGDLVFTFLNENKVSTAFCDRYGHGKTAISLAFLDDHQDAAYSFYKEYPGERLRITMPVLHGGDIILFGSYYALTASIREGLTTFIRMARSCGAYIIYDPNFRKPHLPELDLLKPWILENISLSSLVRGSDEDFMMVFNAIDSKTAFQHVLQAGCPGLIYTKNKEGVELLTTDEHLTLPVPRIDPVSTIGAGDAFNAGIIYALLNQTPTLSGWGDPDRVGGPCRGWPWDSILQTGISFSENVCLSLDNYITVEFGKALNQQF